MRDFPGSQWLRLCASTAEGVGLIPGWGTKIYTLHGKNIKWKCGCSVAQSCPTLCDPMDCSTPGSPVSQSLLRFMFIESVMPSNHLILYRPFFSCLQSFPASGSFQMSQFFVLGGQSIGASASASVLPMNIQDWFPLGLTGLIALQSKGFSRVVSSTTIRKHQFFGGSAFFMVQLSHPYMTSRKSIA